MSAAVRPTGMDPRVPQKRTRIARSAPVEGLHRLRRHRGECLARRAEHRQHQVEAADLQDLGHHRLRAGDDDLAGVAGGLLGGDHQAAQTRARHVLEAGHVEHPRRVLLLPSLELRYKIALSAKEMQRFVGVEEPQAGVMLESTLHQTPARVRAADYVHLIVEFEIAFRLAADLPSADAPYTRESLTPFVQAAMPAIEI